MRGAKPRPAGSANQNLTAQFSATDKPAPARLKDANELSAIPESQQRRPHHAMSLRVPRVSTQAWSICSAADVCRRPHDRYAEFMNATSKSGVPYSTPASSTAANAPGLNQRFQCISFMCVCRRPGRTRPTP